MELSLLIAKIIALIYISSGIAVLIGQINFNNIAADFKKSTALTFVCGSFGIIIGMVLVNYHNNWVKNWTILITIISWAFLIGSLLVVIFPKSLSYFSKYYKHSPVWGILMIYFGLLFGYFGFVQ
jgi:predicted MFS family arabinose efflux permease